MKVRQAAQGRDQTTEAGLEQVEDGRVPVSVARDLLDPALEGQTSTHEGVRGRCLLLDEEHADPTRFGQIGGVGRERAHEDVEVPVQLHIGRVARVGFAVGTASRHRERRKPGAKSLKLLVDRIEIG